MEKEEEQNLSTDTKCPFSDGARKNATAGARTNAHWTYTEANAALEGLPPYTR